VRAEVTFDSDMLVGRTDDEIRTLVATSVAELIGEALEAARQTAGALPLFQEKLAVEAPHESMDLFAQPPRKGPTQGSGGGSGPTPGGQGTTVNVGVSFPIGSNGSSVDVSITGSAGGGGGKIDSVMVKWILK
jgi:type II secretory pathway pseudopilin PulG